MSKTLEPQATTDPQVAVLHSGRTIRMIRNRILCRKVDTGFVSRVLIIPDNVRKSLTVHGDIHGKPVAAGQVLAIGPAVKNVKPGDYLLLDPLNTDQTRVDGRWYYFNREFVPAIKGPRKGKDDGSAVLLVIDELPEDPE